MPLPIRTGTGIRYALPQIVRAGEDFVLSLRVKEPVQKQMLCVYQGETLIHRKALSRAVPAEMIQVAIQGEKIMEKGTIEVSLQ